MLVPIVDLPKVDWHLLGLRRLRGLGAHGCLLGAWVSGFRVYRPFWGLGFQGLGFLGPFGEIYMLKKVLGVA